MTCTRVGFSVSFILRTHCSLQNFRDLLIRGLSGTILRTILACILIALLAAIPLRAQQSATSSVATGIVRTAAGQPIAGATVSVSTPLRNKK